MRAVSSAASKHVVRNFDAAGFRAPLRLLALRVKRKIMVVDEIPGELAAGDRPDRFLDLPFPMV